MLVNLCVQFMHCHLLTRMHSSKMYTARSLTVFPGFLPFFGGWWPQLGGGGGGDLSWKGDNLSWRGGDLSWGVTYPPPPPIRPSTYPCDHVTCPMMHLMSHFPPSPSWTG